MALTSGKNGKAHVLEISNRASVQKLTLTDVAGITSSLENHYSGLNTNAHQVGNIAGLQSALDDKAPLVHSHVISDINGLQDSLDSKADNSELALKADVFTGFTGVLNVVTFVDFPGEAVTTAEITIENGIIVSIV